MGNRWGNSGWPYFWGSKITADGDCSPEIKRRLVLGRKAMTNLDSILKIRDIVNKDLSSQGYDFSSGHVWMWELDYKESWVLKSCCFWTVVLEKALESPLDCKEIQPVHPKGDQSWVFFGRTDNWSWNPNTSATWCEELTHLKRLWCWEGLGAGGEGDDRGWDCWMASPTQWTWVWVDSGSWWWTGRPDVLQSMGSQRVGHNWLTELNWTEYTTSHQSQAWWLLFHHEIRYLSAPLTAPSPDLLLIPQASLVVSTQPSHCFQKRKIYFLKCNSSKITYLLQTSQ